jgi:hypothetical protein
MVDLPNNSDGKKAALKLAKLEDIKPKSLGFGWSFRSRPTRLD